MEVVLDDEDNDEDDDEEDDEDEDDPERLSRTFLYVHTFFALWYHRPDLPAHDIPQSVQMYGPLPP